MGREERVVTVSLTPHEWEMVDETVSDNPIAPSSLRASHYGMFLIAGVRVGKEFYDRGAKPESFADFCLGKKGEGGGEIDGNERIG